MNVSINIRREMDKIPVRGGELRGETVGSGEPILFIHGAFVAETFGGTT
jgi:hypothetical protein